MSRRRDDSARRHFMSDFTMDRATQLHSISPLDGRYADKMAPIRDHFSEFALIRSRLRVEVYWLTTLIEHGLVPQLSRLSDAQERALNAIWHDLDNEGAMRVKQLEDTTNHDVKACEYYLRERIASDDALNALIPASEFVHFAATSEDINNLAYGLLIRACLNDGLTGAMQALVADVSSLAQAHAWLPMLSRTHGQSASPTTLGKEFAVFSHRLQDLLGDIGSLEIPGKFNGAVGNFNAHAIAFPEVDWPSVSADMVKGLGLNPQVLTTQIEPHDGIARLCHAFMRFNSALLDLNRDLWAYISLGYLKQKKVATETGSSTMPHKVNPIDFENSEGNIGISNAILGHLAEKLPVSRWQRDLSDSTSMRNLGTGIGHSWLAIQSTRRGLGRIQADPARIAEDLDQAWEVLAEAAQTVMRREGISDAYERLKSLTRGEKLNRESWLELVKSLGVSEDSEARLSALTPSTYIGLAAQLAQAHSPTSE